MTNYQEPMLLLSSCSKVKQYLVFRDVKSKGAGLKRIHEATQFGDVRGILFSGTMNLVSDF